MILSYDVRDINKALWYKFRMYKYHVENVYYFDWEADFMALSESGYLYEFEIKTSYSDFKADFKKKEKHKILSAKESYIQRGNTQADGWIKMANKIYKEHTRGKHIKTDTINFVDINGVKGGNEVRTYRDVLINFKPIIPNKIRPHKFLYICPEGVIPLDEVPEYAGLMYFYPNNRIYTNLQYIKRPSFLHKEEIPRMYERLNKKIYWGYRNVKIKEYGLNIR